MSMTKEQWKTYPGDHRYEVSTHGRVRNSISGRILKPWKASRGYLYVGLGRSCKKLVARLVLETFEGPGDGLDACHNNGNMTDNRAENLRWDSRKNNLADRAKHGTEIKGSGHVLSKLTEDDIPLVFDLRSQGLSYAKIGNQLSVSRSRIAQICRKEAWKHVEV